MNLKKRKLAIVAGVSSVLMGVVTACPGSNPLGVSASVVDGALTISTTERMDTDWFWKSGGFDRTKTDLRVTYSIGGTDCSRAVTSTFSSTTIGEFTPVLNLNDGTVIGYLWRATVDISAYAEQYTLHIWCDGTQHVHGCNDARTVTVTVQAFDQSGAPITYVDASGVTQPVQVTLDAGSIAPVLADTITETNCDNSCGIGQCVASCEHACPKGPLDRTCRNACQCTCKIEKHNQEPSCHQNAPTACN